MKMTTVRISERLNTWELTSEAAAIRHFGSAAAALAAVKAESSARVGQTGVSESVVIDWYPVTLIGRQVVRSLQD